jgi:hypothetical protein
MRHGRSGQASIAIAFSRLRRMRLKAVPSMAISSLPRMSNGGASA